MRMRTIVTIALLAAAVLVPAIPAAAAAAPARPAAAPTGLKPGQDANGPWWMKQTALTASGEMTPLSKRDWWPRALALKTGESFLVPGGPGPKDQMLVRRETLTVRDGRQLDSIVWVIDDDSDGSLAAGGDGDSDCYVADYGRDGVVDRMVDYMDNDGDGVPDEMDIRYFADGRLNYCWFGVDLDRDGKMWSLRGYEYGGDSYFESDPYGDNIFYMNKFNPEAGTWSPISECPFSFYDHNGDGAADEVIRVSAVPLAYDPAKDPDYANSAFARPWEKDMAKMGIVNVRHSFDIDRGAGPAEPLHYDMGFNLVGHTPYDFPGMVRVNALRRAPQASVVVPWKDLPAVARSYQARETGFTWHENFDDTTAIGAPGRKANDFRWEGVFWVWERRFMENTGGPCQKWNVRREWMGKASDRRELYYSGVDRRIHLLGASEGWIQIGNYAGMGAVGEIRMSDTDGNGIFDRWEVYRAGDARPVRVTQVRDEKARRIDLDQAKITDFYLKEVLPGARAANAKLMTAMNRLGPFDLPAAMTKAVGEGPENYRRFAEDVVREWTYQALRDRLLKKANPALLADGAVKDGREFSGDLRSREAREGIVSPVPDSQTAWRLARLVEQLDAAYGAGDYDRAAELVDAIAASPLAK